MESLLLAAMVAAASPPAPAPLDLSCYRLMAEMADAEDPHIRSTAIVAAQYFLGRIDASAPDSDLGAPLPLGESREALVRRCGDAMQAGGHDFRTIGEALAPRPRPSA